MKKTLLWIIVMVLSISTVAAFSLYGCKTAAAPAEEAIEEGAVAEEETTEPESKKYAGTTITVMSYQCADFDALKELAPSFTEETGINLNFIEEPYANMYEKVVMQATSGSSEVDVWAVAAWWQPLMQSSGYLEELGPYIAKQGDPDMEDIYGPVTESYKLDDKIYGLPWYPNVMLLYYNQAFLEEAGVDVPETWEEFLIASQKLQKDTDNDGNIDRWGAAMPLAKDDSIAETFLVFLYGAGGDWIRGLKGGDLDPMEGTDQYLKPTMNNEYGLKALTFLAELYQTKALAPGCINYSFFEGSEALAQGLIALYPSYGDQAPSIFGSDSKEAVNIKTAPMLKFEGCERRSIGGGWGIGINVNSKNKEAAYEFIKFFYGNIEVAKKLAALGAMPSRKSVLEDPELLETHPYFSTLDYMLPYSKLLPFIAEYPETSFTAAPFLQQAVMGEITPKQALDAIAKNTLDILTRAGYYEK